MAEQPDDDKTQTHVVLTKGTMVSHYRIVEKIGAGGMGEVYLAEDTQLDRKVALKFLPPHLCKDEDCRARFKREAQAAAKLDHPNIVPVYEVGEFQGQPFFAMAHIAGQSLREVIKTGRLSINEAVHVAMQLCEGLQKAHESGVVHRDIKPGNIIVDRDGRARLLDFGLATVAGADKLTKTGSTLGTVGYMSPEQVRGERIDHRSDLFSLGAVLYEMVTGRSPFQSENEAATTHAILTETPQPLARFCADVPDGLQDVVDRSLEKDSQVRYQHADDLLAGLRRLRRRSSDPALATGSGRLGATSKVLIAASAVVVLVGAYFVVDRAITSDKSAGRRWVNSVAVLPFRDLSPDADQEYFCDGMTDAIIDRLSSIRDLKVISMTSAMQFKSSNRDLKEIGDRLGVTTVLEGTIAREGDRIRVRAQLIDVQNDAHLWSDRYDREMKGVFAVQDDISLAILEVLRIELLGEDESSVTRRVTNNPDAYNAYMQGRFFWRKRTEQSIRRAINFFETAIGLDSNFALAYSGLADAWYALPACSEVPRGEALAKAREAARIAVSLDDGIAEVHASLGQIYRWAGDIEEAEKEYLKALALNPGYAWAHVWYADLLGDRLGRPEDQIRHLEAALEVDPLSIVALSELAAVLWNREDPDTVEQLYQRMLEIEPGNGGSRVRYAILLLNTGRTDEALAQFEWAVDVEPYRWDSYYTYADAMHGLGRTDEAEDLYRRAIAMSPDNPDVLRAYADFLYYTLDDKRRAIEPLTKAISIDSSHTRSYNLLAYAYEDVGEIDKALWAASKAIETAQGEKGDYIHTWAEIQYNNGNLDSAIAGFRRFLDLRPDWLLVVRQLADAYLWAREYDRADSLYRVLAGHYAAPDRAWGRVHASGVLRHQGRFREALDSLMAGIDQDRAEHQRSLATSFKRWVRAMIFTWFIPDVDSVDVELDSASAVLASMGQTNPAIYWHHAILGLRAQTFERRGDSSTANRLLEQLRSSVDSADESRRQDYPYFASWALRERGDYEASVRLCEELLSYRKSNDVQFLLGLGYFGAGRAENAIACFERCLFTNRKDVTGWPELGVLCHYYLARAYESVGQLPKASEQYETFLDIWKNADEGLESVEDARARLARLKAGT